MQSTSAWRVQSAFIVTTVIALLLAGWSAFQVLAQPPRPDSFYKPPTVLPSGPPGTIIRSEPISSVPPAGARAWRVLYTSTDPSGRPIAVSGVIVAPDRAAPDGGWPVLAWAHGTTGVTPKCAPSLEQQGGIARVPEYARVVDAGTIVAITDYPGLGTPGIHPYLVGASEGRAVLDSIRAARTLLGADAGPAAAVFGHSQGGHAALFADQIAPTYAPDVRLSGVAAMAPPTDLGELMLDDAHQTSGIVLTALALRAWSDFYPDADEAAIIRPKERAFVDDLATRCIETTRQTSTDTVDVLALRHRFMATDPSTQPGWSSHFHENTVGTLPTDVPVLIAQGLSDDIVGPGVTRRFVRSQCAKSVGIELDTYAGIGHFGVRTVAAPAVVGWLLDRLTGVPAHPGCVTVQSPSSPTPNQSKELS